MALMGSKWIYESGGFFTCLSGYVREYVWRFWPNSSTHKMHHSCEILGFDSLKRIQKWFVGQVIFGEAWGTNAKNYIVLGKSWFVGLAAEDGKAQKLRFS